MLARGVLCVVNEFSSVPRLLMGDACGRQAGHNDHGYACPGRVVHTASQVLCTHVHMDQDHLRLAGDH